MNKAETAQLLCLIKLSYPVSYRDLSARDADAVTRIWYNAFGDIPYQVMALALDRHVMRSKYAPTLAEIAAELRSVYYDASKLYWVYQSLDDREGMAACKSMMVVTARFADDGKSVPDLSLMNMDMKLLMGSSGAE